jgi:hypothetical protein
MDIKPIHQLSKHKFNLINRAAGRRLSVRSVGRVSIHVKEYFKSAINPNYEEFGVYIYNRLGEAKLYKILEGIVKDFGVDIEDVRKYMYKRIVLDTFFGALAEDSIKKMLAKKYDLHLDYTDEDTDVSFSVDLYNNCTAIQIKPHTYLSKNPYNVGLQQSKVSNAKKHEKYKQKTGVTPYYLYYDKDTHELIKESVELLTTKYGKSV